MASNEDRVPGFQDWVFLRPQPGRWERLPPRVQKELRKKRLEVLGIRRSIAERALVPVMPPVEILDTAWRTADPAFPDWGAVGCVLVGGNVHFGVALPGASILALDASALRYFLLRAFSHCFWFERRLLKHLDSAGTLRGNPWPGSPKSSDESYSRYAENPFDWFGKEDALAAKRELSDSQLRPYLNSAAAVAFEWVERGLPVEGFPTHLPGTEKPHPLGIDCATIAHIRALGSRSTSPRRRSACLAHTGTISIWLDNAK